MLVIALTLIAIVKWLFLREATMPKVGRFVTDRRASAYCQITLDGGEKVVVNHEKGGFKGAS